MYEKLKARMTEKNITQKALASKLNLSEGAISSRLKGKTGWTIDDIKKVSSILELSNDDITRYFF